MSLNAAMIQAMVDKGLSAQDIADIAKAGEAKVDRTAAERQASDRERQPTSERKGSSWRRRAYDRVAQRDGSFCVDCGDAERWTWRKGGLEGSFDDGDYRQTVHRCTTLDLDHDRPLWAGGTNADENLRLRCVPCHRRKTSAEQSERLRSLGAGRNSAQESRRDN